MINPEYYYNTLANMGINYYTGVPDSLLKNFCSLISNILPEKNHFIAANEGLAIASAAGYYLGTGKIGLVYMQNSGLGNAVNPLTSLCDTEVYSIPMVLLIGWRGEPNVPDEPQHIKQGKITLELLKTIGIEYRIISGMEEEDIASTKWVVNEVIKRKSPMALIVKKDTFSEFESIKQVVNKIEKSFTLEREQAIVEIAKNLPENSIVIATTGHISRELYEFRELAKESHQKDFLTVGSMGHASQIAATIAQFKPNKLVYCFDGDGACLMHMGSLATNGSIQTNNFKHIIFNNGAHFSVGGQSTVALKIDLSGIAKACKYQIVLNPVQTVEELQKAIVKMNEVQGSVFLEVKVKKGARKNLGRPEESPKQNKFLFMNNLKNG